MAWIVAESLNRLLTQLSAIAPNRSRVSDGSIGDASHQSKGSASDHNPRWIAGANLVTAFDVTHDPAGGLDCEKLMQSLQLAKDPRLKYAIWNSQIMSGAGGPRPWVRRPYKGPSPHTEHLHLSVVGDHRARDASPWMLPGLGGQLPAPMPSSGIYAQFGDRNDRVLKLQHFMGAVFSSYNSYQPTGFFGEATKYGVEEFQRRTGLKVDGVVGPFTLRELGKFGFTP